MRLLVLNGSPRGPKSNTDLLLRPFLAGFAAAGGEVEGPLHLVRPAHAARTEAATSTSTRESFCRSGCIRARPPERREDER